MVASVRVEFTEGVYSLDFNHWMIGCLMFSLCPFLWKSAFKGRTLLVRLDCGVLWKMIGLVNVTWFWHLEKLSLFKKTLLTSRTGMELNKGRIPGKMEFLGPIAPFLQTPTTLTNFKPRIRLGPSFTSHQLWCTELLEDMEESISIRDLESRSLTQSRMEISLY